MHLLYALLALSVIGSEASCWSSVAYHESVRLLALGIGKVDSDAVCVYGTDPNLNDQCPFPCWTLISSTLGDCYARNPDYVPRSSSEGIFDSVTDVVVAPMDPKVKGKGAREILEETIAGRGKCDPLAKDGTGCVKAITCRNWMIDELDDP